jgi:hypothetical protein
VLGLYFHLKTETDWVSETFCCLVIRNSWWWTKTTKPMIRWTYGNNIENVKNRSAYRIKLYRLAHPFRWS